MPKPAKSPVKMRMSQSSSEKPAGSRLRRGGKIAVLTAVILVPVLGFTALAVDATYLMKAKTDAYNAAEAAALAGVYGLTHPDRMLTPPDMTQPIALARTNAVNYGAKHNVVDVPNIVLDRNESNSFDGDIHITRLRTWSYQNYPWDASQPEFYNTVRVTVRRTADRNGPIGMFFSPVFALFGAGGAQELQATATARMEIGVVVGFDPESGQGSSLMPFAICVTDFDEKIFGITTDGSAPVLGLDEYAWVTHDADGNEVAPYVAYGQSDGYREIFMYPQNFAGNDGEVEDTSCGATTTSQGGVQPGSFGTVDIGEEGNSTAALIDQILNGVSAEDFAYMESLGIDMDLSEENPDFNLNSDTGISAGIKNALESIIGECRTVLLYSYSNVGDPSAGNNAYFQIVRYQPIRIMAVNLTKNPKEIIVQPAICQDGSAVIDPDQTGPNLVFHPPRLIE